MTPSPRLRRFGLTAHLAVSVGWVGAVVAYLALVVAAWTSRELQVVRAAWIAMELIARSVLVPLAVGSLATGVLMALGTRWGLFRHYWVLLSLLLTAVAALVLVGHVPTVSYYTDVAVEANRASRVGLRGELLHAGGGLLVLLSVTGLNVCKPRGLTPYGRRKRREQRATPEE